MHAEPLEQIIRRYADMVYRLALAQTHSPAAAIFQGMFLRYATDKGAYMILFLEGEAVSAETRRNSPSHRRKPGRLSTSVLSSCIMIHPAISRPSSWHSTPQVPHRIPFWN